MKYRLIILTCIATLLGSSAARADAPSIETTSPRLTAALLEDVTREVLEQGRIGDRPGQRLSMSCNDGPLPPGWQAGATKPLFGWSCMVRWEHSIRVVSGSLWAPTASELWNGQTDGNEAGLKEALRNKLMSFLKIKSGRK